MRTVRLHRVIDLIGHFPRAEVRSLDVKKRRKERYAPITGVAGLSRMKVAAAGEERDGFLEHPERSLVFRGLRIPHGARLQGSYALAEEVWEKPGDGVRFRLRVAARGDERLTLLEEYIDPKSRREDRRWFDFDLDLKRWIGERVDVFFETDGGPGGNTDFAWAFWASPRLVSAAGKVLYDFRERFQEASLYREAEPSSVYPDEVCIDEDLRPVIFQHPSSALRYPRIEVHPRARLRFGVGVDPSVWEKEGDGVDFEVWVEAGGARSCLFKRYLDPKNRPADRRWHDVEIDLLGYSGREIVLELVTTPGPHGDDRYDWAVWSSPRIESEGREVRLAEQRDPNVLLITVDTLRADHLGCYGNGRVRTPAMDRLAERGIRFDRAWCQSNITIPSHLAILTGTLPHRHALNNRRHRLSPDLRTLPQFFQEAGYRTFAATGVHILNSPWTEGIERGVDEFDSIPRARRVGERTGAAFRDWLERHHQEPFFAWIHLFDPHAPYVPTAPFNRLYYPSDRDERSPEGPGLADMELPPFMADTRRWLDGVTDPAFPAAQYAAQVTHADAVVGGMLEDLEAFGLDERTVVALTADHGESLGEHGVWFNHFGLHEEVARVPLILALPGPWIAPNAHFISRRLLSRPRTWKAEQMLVGRTVSAEVMAMDLAPTLLNLAGLEVPGDLDARDLAPLIRGDVRQHHAHVTAEHTDLAQVLIVRDGWKYLRTHDDLEYCGAFALRAGEEFLYDIRNGANEEEDVARREPGRLREMRALADELLEARQENETESLEMDDRMAQRLRDLGYPLIVRILQVAHGFPPLNMAGAEIFAYGLCRALAGRGHRVVVFHRRADPRRPEYELEEAEVDGLRVFRVNNTFRECRDFERTYRNEEIDRIFGELLDAERPDVVHFQHVTCLSTSLVEEAHRRSLPIVYTLHDYWLICQRGQFLKRDLSQCGGQEDAECVKCLSWQLGLGGGGQRMARALGRVVPSSPAPWVAGLKRAIRALDRARAQKGRSREAVAAVRRRMDHVREMCGKVDRFLSPSRFLSGKYAEFGIPEDRITYSRYGFDVSAYRGAGRGDREGVRFGYLGTFIPSKGVHVLIEAFNGIADPSASLHLHGRALPYEGFEDYEEILKSKIRSPRIHLEGPYENRQVAEILAGLDVLVVPSIWYENSPLTIQEAFLAGVPVVTSDAGGMAELVEHGRNGLLFRQRDPASLREALERLIRDRRLRESLRPDPGSVKTLERNAEEHEAYYADLLRARGASEALAVSGPRRGSRPRS